MDPRYVHDQDQLQASLKEMADSMGYYRKLLIDRGFSKDGAEQLVTDLHASQLELANAQTLGGDDG